MRNYRPAGRPAALPPISLYTRTPPQTQRPRRGGCTPEGAMQHPENVDDVLGKLKVHAWILYRHWLREGPANSPKNRYQEKQQGNGIELGHCGSLSGSTGEILQIINTHISGNYLSCKMFGQKIGGVLTPPDLN